MEYTLQVFTGPWQTYRQAPEKILRRIDEISSRIPVNRVIIGWKTDAAF